MNVLLCCPQCKNQLADLHCVFCKQQFKSYNGITQLISGKSKNLNRKTIDAYKLYSRFYSFIALLTYWVIWRGNLTQHLNFFRELSSFKNTILDIATGEGSLTSLALLGRTKKHAQHIVAVDISKSMLAKAQSRLKDRATLLQADVEQLPFLDQSFEVIACFGGLNSFPSGKMALRELKRVLKPGGLIRGSFLLMPQTSWRKKLVRRWIEQGYQTTELTMELFNEWIAGAGLRQTITKRHGDVVLFELQ